MSKSIYTSVSQLIKNKNKKNVRDYTVGNMLDFFAYYANPKNNIKEIKKAYLHYLKEKEKRW